MVASVQYLAEVDMLWQHGLPVLVNEVYEQAQMKALGFVLDKVTRDSRKRTSISSEDR
jgi:hypothetical protein